MKIGVLETGKIAPDLLEKHGSYGDMFGAFLGGADADFEVKVWDVVDGHEIPNSPSEADGWLVTGSKHGVYEDHAWIAPLRDFLASAHHARVPIVGICFGHQILAEALGGKVEKSDRGWGCGLHSYRIDQPQPWMTGATETVQMHVMHQDQIVELPKGAQVIGGSDFCPYAMVAYGNTSISIQAHPEFEHDYEADLIRMRRNDPIPATIADEGLRSLANGAENRMVAAWIAQFFKQARGAS